MSDYAKIEYNWLKEIKGNVKKVYTEICEHVENIGNRLEDISNMIMINLPHQQQRTVRKKMGRLR